MTRKRKPKVVESVLMSSSIALRPGFMDALRAFQYGETAEESLRGYEKMMAIAGIRTESEDQSGNDE